METVLGNIKRSAIACGIHILQLISNAFQPLLQNSFDHTT